MTGSGAGRAGASPDAGRLTPITVKQVDLDAPGWAVIGDSGSQALADRAVLPVMFGALDGEASWLDEERVRTGPHRLFSVSIRGRPSCRREWAFDLRVAERAIIASHETIRRWVIHFGPIYAGSLRVGRPAATGRWHLDEVFVSIAGRQMYVWRGVAWRSHQQSPPRKSMGSMMHITSA